MNYKEKKEGYMLFIVGTILAYFSIVLAYQSTYYFSGNIVPLIFIFVGCLFMITSSFILFNLIVLKYKYDKIIAPVCHISYVALWFSTVNLTNLL